MPSWSRFASGERKSAGSVLPITSRDDDVDVKYHSKPSPPPPRRRSGPQQQPLGLSRWLWLFLLVNIVAVLFFMFASAFYFPPVVSDSVVQQALAQGDPGFRQEDAESMAPVTELTAEPGGGDTSVAPSVTLAREVQQQQQQEKDIQATTSPGGGTEPDPTPETEDAKQEPSPMVESVSETLAPVELITVDTTTTAEPVQQETEPPGAKSPAEKAQDVKTHQPANSVADLIAKMKERRGQANAAVTPEETVSALPIQQQQQQNEQESTLAPKDGDGQVDSTNHEGPNKGKAPTRAPKKKKLAADKTKNWEPLDEDAIRKNLLVWLKADKGVQVESLSECQATGEGSSCDVKAWISQVTTASQTTTPEAFTPATKDQARPTFISNIYNRNELPALFFSCPLMNANLKLHEYMTLFFVLSPAQIEVANSAYKAQKFFGNSPYGQFFFHGGKPGFLSNGGVRELDEKASSGNFYLLTYRLQHNSVEIKMNRQQWGGASGTAAANGEDTVFAVRMSDNAALSLGNVKAMCDTNAFQGRVAEVMIYDTILTDGRVDEVETYLEHKWWDEPFETAAPTELPPVKDNQRPDEQSPGGANATGPTEPGQNDNPDEVERAGQGNDDEGDTAGESPPDEENPQTNENDDAPTAAAANEEEQEQTLPPFPPVTDTMEPLQPAEPITFNPEDVFEWTPPDAVLALKEGAQDLVGEWKRHVREKIEAIRGFHLGGEVLRAFIRNRKDELIALRQEFFG